VKERGANEAAGRPRARSCQSACRRRCGRPAEGQAARPVAFPPARATC